ncbi:D-alanyl-D-alanine carboxypeptidase family protein [Novisyntrophococcus fermenticellae]|uniref:D-alanyl-D-alanine carboxypeptidase family protein n=1 Tax=Novisyntrophococcus fermenticellae TaxID=2068655 RepID=UPI001E2A9925|nr:D-alanyl-D-alanine carboxypeptidase family protein [Novisyntrophococcus fermenticellae]
MKKFLIVLLTLAMILPSMSITAKADLELASPSVILMESSTGQILYGQNADEQRSPASITKIMTLILIFDELDKGNLELTDQVTTSAHAKSMGGSQVFLEEGEQQTVETMIKCIVIASGNDASVAMAEHIAGSEAEFVSRMNTRAKELGMNDTNFEDCCGLTDSTNHYTTAHDVALMSRELVTHYPQVLNYSSIWMEDITHVTKQGTKPFTLSNTNKLIRGYEGCVGLKTGSTSLAKYCVSAVAERGGIQLISVVMGAPDYKVRFADAASMLNYGFGICNLYVDENQENPGEITVKGGTEKQVGCTYEGEFRYLDTEGKPLDQIEKAVELPEHIKAPVKKGDVAGKAVYTLEGKEIGQVNLLYEASVEKAGYLHCLGEVWQSFLAF